MYRHRPPGRPSWESVDVDRRREQLTERPARGAAAAVGEQHPPRFWLAGEALDQARSLARNECHAKSAGLTQRRYTDPSGFDERATVSTARPRCALFDRAMRLPGVPRISATRCADPGQVAGTVHNTNPTAREQRICRTTRPDRPPPRRPASLLRLPGHRWIDRSGRRSPGRLGQHGPPEQDQGGYRGRGRHGSTPHKTSRSARQVPATPPPPRGGRNMNTHRST